MPLQKLQLRAGIDRSITSYSNEGGYYSCDKVRFRYGAPEKIGGWVKYSDKAFLGTARGLFNWMTLHGNNLLAIATNVKYYIESNGGLYDITPIRTSTVLALDPFSTTAGSTTLVVFQPNHGAATGDYVTFADAYGFAGVAALMLNVEFAVTATDNNFFTVQLPIPATDSLEGGGPIVTSSFQWNAGGDISVPGNGWGAGVWSRKAWGDAADEEVYTQLQLWSQEAFGEDHVFCKRGGPIYYWENSLGINHRATALTAIPGGDNVPLMANCLLLSTADRHLFAFGTNPIGSTVQDPLLIRWCDTESLSAWTPSITNAAGDLRLSSGNHIVTAVRTKQETLVFTDGSIFALQAVGAPDIFGITPVANNISIASSNAAAVAGNAVYWMGDDKFYTYSGQAMTLPCSLSDWVFDDISFEQKDQIFSGTNEGFSEIWWFYCSAGSNTVNRYIIYNYDEKLWSYGSLSRTAWLDSPLKSAPVAAYNNYIYYQETGVDDDRTAPIHAYVESSDFDIADGDSFMFITRVLPDITFTGSAAAAPAVTFTLTARDSSGGNYRAQPAAAVARSAVLPVEQYTEQCDVRLRGRQVKIRIESTALGTHWRLGTPRVDMQQDGRK